MPNANSLGKGRKHRLYLRYLEILCVPVSLAVIGVAYNFYNSNNALRQQYVSLCIQILSQKSDGKDPSAALKPWAVKLLNQSSPVPLPEDTRKALSGGVAYLPPADIKPVTEQNQAMAFSDTSTDASLDMITLMNSMLAILNNDQRDAGFDSRVKATILTQREGILRKHFGSNTYDLFIRFLNNQDSLSDEEVKEIKPILEWSQNLLRVR